MIVEHVFVTTLESTDALRQASDYLTARGFEVVPQQAFGVGGDLSTLSLRRGRSKPGRAKRADEMPQEVRIEYDRGRVTVAASVRPNVRQSFGIGSGDELPPHSPKLATYRQLLTAIAEGLEATIGLTRDPARAVRLWEVASDFIEDDATKTRRRQRILWTVLAVVIALTIAAITMAVLD